MSGNGAWRRLVAHLNGVQEVAGSNPVAPTIPKSYLTPIAGGFFVSQTHQMLQYAIFRVTIILLYLFMEISKYLLAK